MDAMHQYTPPCADPCVSCAAVYACASAMSLLQILNILFIVSRIVRCDRHEEWAWSADLVKQAPVSVVEWNSQLCCMLENHIQSRQNVKIMIMIVKLHSNTSTHSGHSWEHSSKYDHIWYLTIHLKINSVLCLQLYSINQSRSCYVANTAIR